MKKCKAIMTKNPVCCLPSDSVVKVAKMMKEENFGAIPVIENEQTRKLLGIVTDRDLALKIVAEGRDVKTSKVSDVMTEKVVTCRAKDDVKEAMDKMSKNQLRRILIVNKNHKVLGVIAQADVATRVGKPKKIASLVKKISKTSGKKESPAV
jgi:CBS domain-containing protein